MLLFLSHSRAILYFSPAFVVFFFFCYMNFFFVISILCSSICVCACVFFFYSFFGCGLSGEVRSVNEMSASVYGLFGVYDEESEYIYADEFFIPSKLIKMRNGCCTPDQRHLNSTKTKRKYITHCIHKSFFRFFSLSLFTFLLLFFFSIVYMCAFVFSILVLRADFCLVRIQSNRFFTLF